MIKLIKFFIFLYFITFINLSAKRDKIVLFSLNYGENLNEINIWIPGKEGGNPEGPQCFSIDEDNNLYIGDRVRIKKFDKNGNLLWATDFIENLLCSIDVKGVTYILYGSGQNNSMIINKNGNKGEEIIEKDMYNTISEYKYVRDKAKSMKDKIRELGTLRIKTKEFIDFIPIEPNSYKDLEIIGKIRDEKGNVKKIKLKKEYKDKLVDKKYNEIDIDGTLIDKNKKIYVITLMSGEDIKLKENFWISSYYMINVFDLDSNLIEELKIRSDPGGSLYPLIDIDADGNIYALEFHADKMDVVKYEIPQKK